MGYTLVSGNKPSSVALHHNHVILFIEMLKQMPTFYYKYQIPKIKWDGAEEHTINNFYTIDKRKF